MMSLAAEPGAELRRNKLVVGASESVASGCRFVSLACFQHGQGKEGSAADATPKLTVLAHSFVQQHDCARYGPDLIGGKGGTRTLDPGIMSTQLRRKVA